MLALLLAVCLAPQDDAAATEAITAFDSTLSKSKDSSARVSAVLTLAKTHHEKVVNRLGTLLTHEEKGLRIAAAQALATFKDSPDLKKPAAHAIGSAISSGSNQKESEVLVALFTALGHLQEESSASVLKSHYDDKDAQIAGAAVTASGALKAKSLVDPLIELLRDCEKKSQTTDTSGGGNPKARPVKSSSKGGGGGTGQEPPPDAEAQKRMRAQNLLPTVQSALQTLTGQTFQASVEWEKWWAKNRASFTPSK